MSPQEIFAPFAKVALNARNELNEIEQKLKIETNPKNKSILKKQKSGMIHLMDRCFRLTGDFLPKHVSRLAKEYCEQNELGDIFGIGWGGQPKFEKKKNRGLCNLKHEHKIPVNALIEKLKGTDNVADALKLFESQEIVWVLKVEDLKLPKSKRVDPDEEYNKAGIEVIKNPNQIGHLFK